MTRARAPNGKFYRLEDAVTPAKVITAAAAVIPTTSINNMPPVATSLQERAWRLWRILGVLNAPTSAKAKAVGRLKWNVEVNGELLEPEAAEAAMRAITQPLSVREASRRIALSLEVAAEVFYARIADGWNVFSPTKPNLKETLKKADIIVRGWQADPERPEEAFSPVLASLGTADQIRLMAQMSRNQDRNRLAQRGILLVPKEWSFPDGDDLQAKLEQSMTAPIADEYAPSSVVPMKLEVPGETIAQAKHLVIESSYDEKLMERIEATIRQYALELDMAPEVLLGNMDSNHWNAWLSSEENYIAHVEPLGVSTGEVYADAMMEAASNTNGEFAGAEIVVTPDPGDMLTKTPSVADIFEAVKLGGVGLDFLRRHMGADEDDAPTESDIELVLRMQGIGQAPEPAPEPDVQEAPVMPEETPMPANGNGSPNGQPVTAAVDDTDEALDRLSRQLVTIDTQLLGRLEGAVGIAVEQARELVGSDDIGAQDAVDQEMQRLGRMWQREIVTTHKALNRMGIETDDPMWTQAAEASVAKLVEGITSYVMDNLHKTESEAHALPVLLLRDVLAAAGGSGIATVAAVSNPSPTFQDPQGFAVGVLPLRGLKNQGVEIVQWRFRYGPLARSQPFIPHKEVDGQFMTADGVTSEGWAPGDHRGCVLAGTVVQGPVALASTLREYEGTVVDLTFASGEQLSITPNHPVLTPQGWVPAGFLDEGGYVVGCFGPHRAAGLVPDDNQAPALIEDVVGALHEAAGVKTTRVPVAAKDFHGDGKGSEIAVVATDSELWGQLMTALAKESMKELFAGVQDAAALPRKGDADPLGFWLRGAALRSVSGPGLRQSLLRSHAGVLDPLGVGVAAGSHPSVDETATNGASGDPETVTQRELRLSRLVAPDQVVKVEHRTFTGHVYNLQTRAGWYVASGVIVHNCECQSDPVFRKTKQPATTPREVG